MLDLVCDKIAVDPLGGYKIVESMHSGVFDLAADFGEVAARIHPVKQKLFDAVLSGTEVKAEVRNAQGELEKVSLNRDVELHVNRAGGSVAEVQYVHVAGKLPVGVRGQVPVKGFDAGADPVIRQMKDGSFRVIFCSMPPRKHPLGAAFDVDAFADALLNTVQATVVWDDVDVIHIPSASADEIREIYRFMLDYGKT